MRNEQTIKDIYKIAGMLEMLTCMQDQPLTSGMVAELVDAVDKLELIGAEMMNASDDVCIELFDPCKHERLVNLLGEHPTEKDVSDHEEAAESTP